jgi:hypothetical protein
MSHPSLHLHIINEPRTRIGRTGAHLEGDGRGLACDAPQIDGHRLPATRHLVFAGIEHPLLGRADAHAHAVGVLAAGFGRLDLVPEGQFLLRRQYIEPLAEGGCLAIRVAQER